MQHSSDERNGPGHAIEALTDKVHKVATCDIRIVNIKINILVCMYIHININVRWPSILFEKYCEMIDMTFIDGGKFANERKWGRKSFPRKEVKIARHMR